MSDLGQMLKKARLENKISLDDLQETTKIRKRYLEAIEDGNYKVLPGNFYVRAFIKSYAEAVGLDPNEVLKLYQNVIPSLEPEPMTEPIRSKRTTRNTEWIGKWASNLMVISFVVLILGIIYYFVNLNYSGGSKDASDDLPKTITDKVAPAPQTAEVDGDANAKTGAAAQQTPAQVPVQPELPKSEVKLVKSEKNTDYYSVAGVQELNIEMTVTGEKCWVEVESAGHEKKVLASQNFLNGNTQTWTVPDTARLVLGRASAVELKINGIPINVGDEANVKRIQIDLQPS
ncbi:MULTISPECIES: helix-turn-helix domain-containing protein [Paenibacillus]|uniref:helix-turn-helix domain-containing protein n=1 Tax=Paenibacillus TaxID=44249 RepID=UPI0010B29F84|nr:MULTISPECIES: helix-turn-helix domain-containing protein [Paenibacillus]GCL71434.1 DUF4115 domain-containing protein [Paenibacillus naphthalenovorans]